MKKFFFSFLLIVAQLFLNSPEPLSFAASKDQSTVVWWGGAFVELDLSGTKVLIDPYGNISSKANLLLVTHDHYDHCSPASIQNILTVSGKAAGLIIASKGCGGCLDGISTVKKQFAGKGETISYQGLVIETVQSVEAPESVGYVIRVPQTGLSIMHLGDNNTYVEDFKNLSGIDYLFMSMGKMSEEHMIALLRDIRPKILVPMHYKPSGKNPLGAGYDYPSPPDSENYIEHLKTKIEQEKIPTKILILNPGEPSVLKTQDHRKGV